MSEMQLLQSLEPASGTDVEELSRGDVFEQLFSELVATGRTGAQPGARALAGPPAGRRWYPTRAHRLAAWAATASVVAGALVLALVLAVPGHTPAPPRWVLAGEVKLSWQQTSGVALVPGSWLTCPSASTCYVDGQGAGELGVTTDAGKTWDVPAIADQDGAPLTPVVCVRASTCAVLDGNYTRSGFFLAESTSTGQSWVTTRAPAGLALAHQVVQHCAANTAGGPCAYEGPMSFSCLTATSCVAVATSPPSSTGTALSREFITYDAGRTWSEHAMPKGFWAVQLQCFTGGICVATGAAAGRSAAVFSLNGGSSWQSASMPAVAGFAGMLACSGASHCLSTVLPIGSVTASQASLLVTNDGGRSWSKLAAHGFPARAAVTGISCPNNSDCWATATATVRTAEATVGQTKVTLVSTTNGGQSWQADQLPHRVNVLYAVSCATSKACFALASSPGTGAAEGLSVGALLAYRG